MSCLTVCRAWRAILRSHPEVWRTPQFTFTQHHSNSATFWPPPRALQELLDGQSLRSLHIRGERFCLFPYYVSSISRFLDKSLMEIISALCPHPQNPLDSVCISGFTGQYTISLSQMLEINCSAKRFIVLAPFEMLHELLHGDDPLTEALLGYSHIGPSRSLEVYVESPRLEAGLSPWNTVQQRADYTKSSGVQRLDVAFRNASGARYTRRKEIWAHGCQCKFDIATSEEAYGK